MVLALFCRIVGQSNNPAPALCSIRVDLAINWAVNGAPKRIFRLKTALPARQLEDYTRNSGAAKRPTTMGIQSGPVCLQRIHGSDIDGQE